jgi:hypothetical protein
MENFISDTKINIKHKILCSIYFCIAFGESGFLLGEKKPAKAGLHIDHLPRDLLILIWFLILILEAPLNHAGRTQVLRSG